jgi:hypothetical protein
MSGYTASAKLRGASTRFVPMTGSDPPRVAPVRSITAPPARPEREWVELVGQPIGERLSARWDDLRETWSQMTFFLFDPESWR